MEFHREYNWLTEIRVFDAECIQFGIDQALIVCDVSHKLVDTLCQWLRVVEPLFCVFNKIMGKKFSRQSEQPIKVLISSHIHQRRRWFCVVLESLRCPCFTDCIVEIHELPFDLTE